MNLSTIQKQTHRHRDQTCGCQGGVGKGEGWTGGLRLIEANYFSYSTENCIQPSGIKHNGKRFLKGIYIYIYIFESLFCKAETGTTL